ncbi:heat shock protein DnaJ domain protein [Methylocella silvestris BL2]|uniref:Heat shock protein DnaJ domain protein n=1 Tax=Methylocella silvestris (strain DSM 15510 / CIP 108128 / LMG 27833 / NCIMB 13906 / BL2) TaxID=395965 RepID=B8EPD4_METSB|nr:heat shock protein DnaJ domain protein [Methylocella silvestris BL2]
MIYLIVAFLMLWLSLAGLRAFANANPATLARVISRGGGIALLVFAAFLMARGAVSIALGFGGLGLWLLKGGRGPLLSLFGWPSAARRSGASARVSCVRSAMIEMQLDHETGKMRGVILAGEDEGRQLDSLTRPQCEVLYELCRRDDPEGARLLEAYLDRRFAGWSHAGQAQGDSRSGEAGRRAGAMTQDEAYEVLGLAKGASREEVVRSHRSLMKKLHPDHGGTTDLAARVNEAKEVLMRRHP